MSTLDTLTRELTTAPSFDALINNEGAHPLYRPSLWCFGQGAAKARTLAEAYDKAQAARGVKLRAFRGY